MLPWAVVVGKRRRKQHAKFGYSALLRFGDACVPENVFALYIRTEWVKTTKFRGDVEDIKVDSLFKFGAFTSSRSGDIGPRNLKSSLQNGR